MKPSVELPVPNARLQAGFPSDWMAVRANGTVVIIHEPGDMGTTAYTVADTTRNPRTIATADAVLWDGQVLKSHYDSGTVSLQHAHAGHLEWIRVGEFLDEPVPLLERTQLVELTGEGGGSE